MQQQSEVAFRFVVVVPAVDVVALIEELTNSR
jgi:hypothetical protein